LVSTSTLLFFRRIGSDTWLEIAAIVAAIEWEEACRAAVTCRAMTEAAIPAVNKTLSLVNMLEGVRGG